LHVVDLDVARHLADVVAVLLHQLLNERNFVLGLLALVLLGGHTCARLQLSHNIRLAIVVAEALKFAILDVAVLVASGRPAGQFSILFVVTRVQLVQRVVERVPVRRLGLDDLQNRTSLRISDNLRLAQRIQRSLLLGAFNAQRIVALPCPALKPGFQLLAIVGFALVATGVFVEFGGEAEALVVLCDGLRLVPVCGYNGIVEDLLLRFGLLADFGDAGAVLLLLDFAAHGCGWLCCFVAEKGALVSWIVRRHWRFWDFSQRKMEAGVAKGRRAESGIARCRV
jgi:hypothetical protein